MLMQQIQTKRILLLGFGREGRSTYHFLREKYPSMQLAIADRNKILDPPNDSNVVFHVGQRHLDFIHDYEIVIKSPGISPHIPELTKARSKGLIFVSQTQIFFELCPGKIIGITGTKGKSTTTSLIYHVLQQSSIPSILLGNIGKPPLDYLGMGDEKTIFVFEMSSHQLMDVTRSPNIAVLQNVVPEHLDYYISFDEYVAAKQNIVRFQTPDDYYIYNADFPIPNMTAKLTPAKKIPFSIEDFDPRIKSKLMGEFNKYNILPAIKIGELLGVSQSVIYNAIESFSPLEHRLQKIGVFRGIAFYDAALSTVPEAAIAAIEALGSNVHTLLCGGYERKQHYESLAEKILSSNIKTLILFPVTGQRIWNEIERTSKINPSINHFFVDNMPEAVKLAYEHTPSGKICLLAPAAPSFTIFKDYNDEAQQFKENVIKFS